MGDPIRSDPINAKYFDSVEQVDRLAVPLFVFIAVLSIVVLLINREIHPWLYDALQMLFAFLVIFLFLIALASRLYLIPRAEDKRRQDFFSNACGVPLVHETTVGYYNNDLTEPVQRVAAQLLENSLFSKNIARIMAKRERALVGIYGFIYLLIVFNRGTDLELIAVISQIIFSEQAISRCVRLEWLRMRFEKTYDDVFRMFQSKPDNASFLAQTLDSLVSYETAKATAGITLSSKIFDQSNTTFMQEWDCIKKKLNI